jgi:putative transposase
VQVSSPTTTSPETPPMDTTLRSLFARLFDRDRVLDRARQLGAVERVRALHPFDVILALVACASGDEHRSVATARRMYHQLTGFMPQESSFYERLRPGLDEVAWEMFIDTLARANRVQRRQIARTLGLRVRDVRAIDASQVTLPARAAAHFPSTDAHLGGFKVTATLSVLHDLLLAAHVTDARQHDRKAFSLPDDTRGVLWLADRGYSDHRLFAQIADACGSFVIRLKSCSEPTVTKIRSGLAQRHLHAPLERSLPVFGVVDLDACFNVGRAQRTFRVVGIPVAKNKQGDPDWIWLATNLPDSVSAESVGAAYRLRWCVENLFRSLKSVGRLDELASGKPAIVRIFIAATLVGLVLSQAICAAMRAERPRCEPSLHRVFALVLANLTLLITAVAQGELRRMLPSFIVALWREGLNPNPGRPYALRRHLSAVAA